MAEMAYARAAAPAGGPPVFEAVQGYLPQLLAEDARGAAAGGADGPATREMAGQEGEPPGLVEKEVLVPQECGAQPQAPEIAPVSGGAFPGPRKA